MFHFPLLRRGGRAAAGAPRLGALSADETALRDLRRGGGDAERAPLGVELKRSKTVESYFSLFA